MQVTNATELTLVNTWCGTTLAFHSADAAAQWLAANGQPGDTTARFDHTRTYEGLTAPNGEADYTNVRNALTHNAA